MGGCHPQWVPRLLEERRVKGRNVSCPKPRATGGRGEHVPLDDRLINELSRVFVCRSNRGTFFFICFNHLCLGVAVCEQKRERFGACVSVGLPPLPPLRPPVQPLSRRSFVQVDTGQKCEPRIPTSNLLTSLMSLTYRRPSWRALIIDRCCQSSDR